MKKAIYIESTANNLASVLSIAPESFAPSHDGREYILIEDYHEPELTDPMDKAYPVYNKTTKKFSYLIEKWTVTAQQYRLDIANLKAEYAALIAETAKTNEALKAQQERSEKAILELTSMIAGLSAGGGASGASIPMPS